MRGKKWRTTYVDANSPKCTTEWMSIDIQRMHVKNANLAKRNIFNLMFCSYWFRFLFFCHECFYIDFSAGLSNAKWCTQFLQLFFSRLVLTWIWFCNFFFFDLFVWKKTIFGYILSDQNRAHIDTTDACEN